jgi:hypothetical protein
MLAEALISARVTAETKQRFAELARRQCRSQSALMKRLVEAALASATPVNPLSDEPPKPLPSSGRISVRLLLDDLMVLRERARARTVATSTYVTFLVRAHLRSSPPLPTEEFLALRKCVMEVAAIGRNFNQMARALNAGERSTGPDRADLLNLLRALEALRDHFHKLLDANSKSWEVGYAKAPD